jgi:hypothetical protein
MARLICIGDVHGHLDELNALLLQVQVRPGDRLVFLGDLVDRGPDSPGVVRRVRGLLHTFPGSTALLGNHESQLVQLAKRSNCDQWIHDLTDEEFHWLTGLPVFTRDPERSILMVHGGLYPRYFAHYPAGVPVDWEAVAALPRKQRERIHRFCRVRYCDPDGDVVALGEETTEDHFWADLYDGREGFVVFGHEPYRDAPRRFPHALGIDGVFEILAAVWDQGPDPVIFRQPTITATTAAVVRMLANLGVKIK